MIERWIDIQGYEGLYQISSHGNVRSLDRSKKANHNNYYIAKGKLLKHSFNHKNYPEVALYNKEGKRRNHRIHKLVATNFLVKGSNQTQINHKDGIKSNNNIDNLEWCTGEENIYHAYETGLYKHGQESHLSLLTEKEVLEIIELRKQGLLQKEISQKFNVSVGAIANILSGKSWNRLTRLTERVKIAK